MEIAKETHNCIGCRNCIDCRYCERIIAVDDKYECIKFPKYLCNKYAKIDYIDGTKCRANCYDYNSDGLCPNWEQKGIKGFIQRLLKRK